MPIITIFGANGTQGASVLEAVLADGKYTPRAVSRSLDSAGSKALIAKGVEVVVANLFDKESVISAIRGSEAVFGNTNFWDPSVFPADPEGRGEITQGKNLVDAAKEVGVKFFIYSSLPNATEASKGAYKHLYHVDNKAIIEDYLRASGVPYAVLMTAWFLENFWNFGALQKTDTGYTIPIPRYGPEDVQVMTWVGGGFGQSALAMLKNYADPTKGVLGKSYTVLTARATYPELAAAISAALKKEVTFTSPETSGLAEIDDMYSFQANIGLYHDTPVPNPDLVALGVKFGTLEEFIQKEVVPRFG
ncbi:NAD(P)-binding protein [Mycena metata]|uniref:NAD(P)-binding protein n=1 Tax=Mycena metata TaxID=1033252 RepID=A0AAD7NXY0_9AGAR|nr:NAD(P)-binding protein [Mycena metata]